MANGALQCVQVCMAGLPLCGNIYTLKRAMDPITAAALALASAAAAALPYVLPSRWFGRQPASARALGAAEKEYLSRPLLDPVEVAFFERMAREEARRARALGESYRRGRVSQEAMGAASAGLLAAQADRTLARAGLLAERRRQRELERLDLLGRRYGRDMALAEFIERKRAGLSGALAGALGAGYNYYLVTR
jgi:hypothetical protein